jgi:nitrogenase iron protein NifH
VDDFVEKTGTSIAGYVNRSIDVQQSELYGKTVIEAKPKSAQADIYRNLAKYIATNENLVVPSPLGSAELRDWARNWGDRIYDIESGVIGTAEAI